MKKFQISQDINLQEMRPIGFHESVNQSMAQINQNVENGAGWIEVEICPICGSSNYKNWLSKHGNKLVICNECTSGFATRQPKNFNDAYNTAEHFLSSIEGYDNNREYRIKRFGMERVRLAQKYKRSGRLLDIGCGTGWFLESAKDVFEVCGFEPTVNLAQFTSNKLGIHIASQLEDFELASFDVITAFDVIEHVPNPNLLLQSAYNLLKENGIFMIFTPNKDSAAFLYMKEKSNLVTPPLHLHYLNAKSFVHLAGNKFTILDCDTAGLDVGDIFAYQRDHESQEFALFLEQNSNLVQTFLDYTNLGNHLRVVLQKN